MTVYVLTKDSPNGAPFILANRTTVQFCVLGSSVTDRTSIVALQIDKGASDYDWYRTTVDQKKPMNVDLAAGTYRLSLDTTSASVSYVVNMLPDAI